MARITLVQGDILKSECQALVNPVNCAGVMGAGLAKQFRDRYPGMYREYREQCQAGKVRTGQVNLHRVKDGKTVINFPAKRHWKDPSSIGYIEDGLESLREALAANNIRSVAVPALGAGLGQLDWNAVQPLIIDRLNLPGLEVEVYGPRGKGR